MNVVRCCRDLQKAQHKKLETCRLVFRLHVTIGQETRPARVANKAEKERKKEEKRNNTPRSHKVTSQVFAQTTYVALPPPQLSCGVGSWA